MIWYHISAYQMCERPKKLPEGTEELWNIFARSDDEEVMPGIGTDTAEDLATLLFIEDFLKLSSIVDDEYGATVLAFKIYLLYETEVDGEKVGECSHREPLQLMWSLDDSGSVGAYMLAYPDSEISSVEDMEILTDEEVARAALGAWEDGGGIPHTWCSPLWSQTSSRGDHQRPTFVVPMSAQCIEYKPDESTGKFVRESDFSEDMS